MSENTKISWAHHTFNPWWGCEKVSEACAHCYAEALSNRYGHNLWGHDQPRKIASEKTWMDPLRWNRDAAKAGMRFRVFCASMADVFEDRDDLIAPRARLMELIAQTPHLDWLLLTKRPRNFWHLGAGLGFVAKDGKLWPNVWLGTTVENQGRAEERVGQLLDVPARVHFLSCEPLLGSIDLTGLCFDDSLDTMDALFGEKTCGQTGDRSSFGARVSWVIAGGESGTRFRPMQEEWVRSLRDQCARAGVPFFYKQTAGFRPDTKPLLDGVRHDAVPVPT